MLSKRSILTVLAATMLAACTGGVIGIDRADKETGPLLLNDVIVDVSDLDVTTEGRAINKTTSELQRDLNAAVTAEALKRSVPGGVPTNINVDVEKVYLAPLSSRLLANTSYIESTVSLTNAETGAFIVEPVKVKATADQLRGLGPVGAATAAANASVEADYQRAVAGYAKTLLASLDASS